MLIPALKAWGAWWGWRGCPSMLHGAWPTSLEDQNISSHISCYRKDMGQKLHARSLLVFDMLQVVAFWFVCFCLFVRLFFSKRVTFVPTVWEEFRVCVCHGVNAVWTVTRANLVLQGLALLTWLPCVPLPGYEVTSCWCGMDPRPTRGLDVSWRILAD